MTTITTRRNLLFCVGLMFLATFMCVVVIISMFFSFDISQKGYPTSKEFIGFIVSIVLLFFLISMIYSYWKNSPKITINEDTIKIGKQIFYFKEIKEIELTGKQFWRFIIKSPIEGTALIFNDGTKKVFFDIMYSNSSEIKLFIKQVILDKQEYNQTLINKVNRDTIRFEIEEIFKGNQFLSFRGILLWGFIGSWIFSIFSWYERQILTMGLLIFSITFCVAWFVLFSWQMHYFGLTNEYLIVRNHNFLWMKRIYRLSDIKEVVFEERGRAPNSMRIITTDFKNKLYPAGTLRNKTWLRMEESLEKRGVEVRNELLIW